MSLTLSVNILAVIVAAVISFILGWLWYGPLFGRQWMNSLGTRRESDNSKKKGMAGKMVTSLIASFVSFYIVAIFIKASGATTLLSGAFVGVLMWLGFFVVKSVDGVLWENKKMAFFYINIAYDLVRFIIIAAILAVWL
ncbi:MAG: DUF1761 domain-containing protein [Nanoarchaeota archaeon]